ncbi:DUF1707 domain-containing protein [Propioniciclava soli]|uniref:DUF1707 SHOCT-like domain-containing protein n=1 Tax=Propioniciclava soli TaxID=2775081 RepID=UPI001E4A6F27
MPELPRSSKYVSMPHAALDDAERNRLVARLNEAYADGAVGSDAYHAHLDRLFSASTLGEVVPVVQDLPSVATHETPALVEVGTTPPGEVAPASAPRPMTTVLLAAAGGVALMVLVVLVLLILL